MTPVSSALIHTRASTFQFQVSQIHEAKITVRKLQPGSTEELYRCAEPQLLVPFPAQRWSNTPADLQISCACGPGWRLTLACVAGSWLHLQTSAVRLIWKRLRSQKGLVSGTLGLNGIRLSAFVHSASQKGDRAALTPTWASLRPLPLYWPPGLMTLVPRSRVSSTAWVILSRVTW